MEKITLNNKRYIGLAEFNHLRKNLIKDVYDRYERDENGKIPLSERDAGYIDALSHIMTEIMYEEVRDAESPEEIKAMHRKLDLEYALHNYIIIAKDPDTGEELYFRKFCEHVNEGEETPVFTGIKRLAKAYSDYHAATIVAGRLRRETGDDTIQIIEAWRRLLPPGEAEKRLLEAIFDGDDEEKSEQKADDKPVDYKNAWVIFCIDEDDNFEFFECVQHMNEVPGFIRRHMKKDCDIEYAVVTTSNVGLATLYSTEDEAIEKIAEIKRLSKTECAFHATKRKMFDNEDSIDTLRMIYSDNTSSEPEYHGDGVKAEDEDWDGEEHGDDK